MTENDHSPIPGPAPTPSPESPFEHIKDVRSLLWLGIISIWLTLAMILFIGSGNFKNARQIKQLNFSKEFSGLMDAMAKLDQSIQKSATDAGAAMSAATENMRADLTGVKAQLQDATRRSDENVARMLEAQKQLNAQLAKELTTGREQVRQTLATLMEKQRDLLAQTQRNNVDETARRELLQRFFENQTTLLKQLSEAFASPVAAK